LDYSTQSPLKFINWLESLLPTLKPASRRQYIASTKQLLLVISENKNIYQCDSGELKIAIQHSLQMQSAQYTNGAILKTWRGRTSSQKTKKLSVIQLKELKDYVASKQGKWIHSALLWITANMIVGLRPSEWRTAKLIEKKEKTIMTVQNSKNTNGRANGKYRTLDITDIKLEELELLKAQIHVSQSHSKTDDSWNKYYAGVRKAIHRISRSCMPYQRRFPTLYSSRHQFAANAKKSGKTKVEIAALMGHATDETAGCNYGKKKYGNGGCRVKADANEMANIVVKTNTKKLKNVT
jgi:integrase